MTVMVVTGISGRLERIVVADIFQEHQSTPQHPKADPNTSKVTLGSARLQDTSENQTLVFFFQPHRSSNYGHPAAGVRTFPHGSVGAEHWGLPRRGNPEHPSKSTPTLNPNQQTEIMTPKTQSLLTRTQHGNRSAGISPTQLPFVYRRLIHLGQPLPTTSPSSELYGLVRLT
ncbi:unnamed protein product [Cuscuta europaea]|uniref:Uncharacterized protein n=1 Tax=Cuscuta europaea TaxID=41803 RepID=A0A9P0ZAX6_CUSEU|nr:unnamed protein product [Cuscuta europaea]